MYKSNDVFITTTNNVEGIRIRQYLRPVSAHIVAGTDIFSDFAASVRDVFGGRSESYQRQLSSIYNEAIDRLKLEASEIGANGILGLKIDIDEISGKGKSMFMITALGTAVVLDEVREQVPEKHETNAPGNVSINQINRLRKKNELLSLAADKELELDNSFWNYIIKNKIPEINNDIFETASYMNTESRALWKNFGDFIQSFDEKELTELLYYQYTCKEYSSKFMSFLKDQINEAMLFDPIKLNALILNTNDDTARKALQLVTIDKQNYQYENIGSIEQLIETIRIRFDKMRKITTVKSTFSSKEKEMWICKCGTKNHMEAKGCSSCYLYDIYGLKKDMVKPEYAISKLQNTIELIKECLNLGAM